MKIAGVSGILGWEEAPVLWGSSSPQSSPRGRGGQARRAHFRTNDGLGGGTTKWGRRVDVGGGIAVGVLSRDVSAWIPAFAGMTRWVRECELRRPE